ncbi:MAG: tail fiber domain-containing protein, partial [Ferruginibacter sp.]
SAYGTISDRKFKAGMAPLQNTLTKIMKLKPASYEFKTGEYKTMHLPLGKQLGLIADELKQVFPELVEQAVHPAQYDEEDRTKIISPEIKYEGINYQGLIPVLIASVQEQQQQIEEQKEENKTLKERISKLEEILTANSNNGNNINLPSNAFLNQNIPNPVSGNTTIEYHVPATVSSANLTITNAAGQLFKTIKINKRGIGHETINTSTFAKGTYNYTLWADGKQVDTKRLIISR